MNDKLMAETDRLIHLFIQQSSVSYYFLFVHPQRSILTPSLSEEQIVQTTAWEMEQLGLHVDT